MLISDSNGIWQEFAIVSCKVCIANSRLSKCHKLNVPSFVVNLENFSLILSVEGKRNKITLQY